MTSQRPAEPQAKLAANSRLTAGREDSMAMVAEMQKRDAAVAVEVGRDGKASRREQREGAVPWMVCLSIT